MPLPLILPAAAFVVGAFGAKKGWDAKQDYDSAERISRGARSLYESEKEALEEARDETQEVVERLGKTKLDIYQQSLQPFVEAFRKVHALDFDELAEQNSEMKVPQAGDFSLMKSRVFEMEEVLGDGAAALGAGGLAGLAAYGGVGLLGSASTGTAISGLAGVAASNATLAWFGGGSLAAGGFGVAGGAMVLGGVVAAPVLAVGGMLASSKATEAKEKARESMAEAKLAAEEMKSARVAALGIKARFEEVDATLMALNERFQPLLQGVHALVENEGPRQAKIRKEEFSKINDWLEGVSAALEAYADSRRGLWNRIKYFFLSNPYEARLKVAAASFCEKIAAYGFNHLGDVIIPDDPRDVEEVSAAISRVEALTDRESGRVSESEIRYDLISEKDKKGLFMTFSMAKVINDIMEAPLLNDEGLLTSESRQCVMDGEEEIAKLEAEQPWVV